MKAVQLLINSVLPEDLRNYDEVYDVKSLNRIMNAVAQKYPDQFKDILHKVSDIGRKASYYQGETITLKDLENVIDKDALFAEMDAEIAKLPKDKNFIKRRREIFQKYNELMEKETGRKALANRNNLAMAILSGARGKSAQLKAMVSSPGTYSDYKGEPIDVFSRKSFSEGVTPAAFAASTYGSRSSVISTKCLDYQSLVKMADLSEKKLCDIQPGDIVLGADKEGKVFPVKVLNVFDQGEKECYQYTFRSSILEPDSIEPIGTVICTKDHKFLNAKHGCPLPIEESHKSNYMRPSVKWKLSDGSIVVATEAEPVGKVHCMDIEVDHPDHLFVLANGIITSNSSTAKGGDLAKQMAQSAIDLVIRKNDCGTKNGIALPIDDSSLKGRVLARDTKDIPAGTVLDREVIQNLRKKGVENLEVRSAETCGVHNGLCSKCVGKYFNGGKWAPIGTHVGALASTSASEPITQMALCINELQRVRMADGTEKAVRDIEPGEQVLGADREGNTCPVVVLNKFKQGLQKTQIYEVKSLETGQEDFVICTPDHKFLSEMGEIIPIKEFVESPWTALRLQDGLGVITRVSPEEETMCYDIEVDHPDHLFVLANGLLVSNSAKHTAGMTQSKKTYSGLDTIIQFTQSPEKFKDQGAIAEKDGKVENIEEAPQGGFYVTIGGKRHYTPQGHDLEVKVGDKVEAGDQISEGLVDAEDIVKYKGLGEGRRYYAERLNKMLADSGAATDKRNTEILARGALRHVRVTELDGLGDYLPDDIVDYNALQATYKPSETSVAMHPKQAVGKYLQSPVMHYTIGTRITPKVADNLSKHEHNEILVDDNEPGFQPEMQRLRAAAHSNPDWLASQGTSYLTKQLNEASAKGDDTNVLENADYRPRLAFGAGFGKNISQTGMF